MIHVVQPPRPLEIDGYGGRPLPCVLFDAGGETSAVVLPGGGRAGYRLGGTPARPDLNYTRALLLSHGMSVLEVWWNFDTAPDGEEGEAFLERSAEAAARAAADIAPIGAIVGRSVGTRALAKLVRKPEWERTPSIWIAPLTRDPEVRSALEAARARAFVVGGTADELFDAEAATAFRKRGTSVFLMEGANHGLEVGGPAASARALADVIDAMDAFVSGFAPSPKRPT